MWDPFAEFERTILPNGLTVYCAHWPKRPWIAVSAMIHSGAKNDHPGVEGTAHFVEHLVSRNQTMGYREIQDHFKNLGGNVELGVTGFNRTYYQFFSPVTTKPLSDSLDLFGKMLFETSIKNFIEDQRKVITGEYYKNFPTPIVLENVRRGVQNVYHGTWRERFLTPLGDLQSLNRICQEDLQSYFDTNYTPSNTSVICTGGIDISSLENILAITSFAQHKNGQRTQLDPPIEDFPLPFENSYVFETSKHMKMEKPLESATFETTYKIPGKHNGLLVSIVMEMLNEQLFTEIRERRGWCYDVQVTTFNFLQFHELRVKIKGLALRAVEEIDNAIIEYIQSLTKHQDLFEKIRERKIVSFAMSDHNAKTVNECALLDIEHHDRIVSYAEEADYLRSLTIQDVYDIVEWFTPERRWSFLVVP